jgi:uncharacterized protein YdeI (YjbR/CyaY-like superfamily)
MDQQIDDFILSSSKWSKELKELREILIECGLHEQFKWRVPCFVHNGKNIALINGFKEHCVLGFFKGALLEDPDKRLVAQSENAQGSRILKFHSSEEIIQQKDIIRTFIFEAIEIEQNGLKINYKSTAEFPIPEELTKKLHESTALKNAFELLTPGRQRGYLLHFNGAKQAKTRDERIEKCRTRILMGKGLNDCICGKSKRMPACDGSHKF